MKAAGTQLICVCQTERNQKMSRGRGGLQLWWGRAPLWPQTLSFSFLSDRCFQCFSRLCDWSSWRSSGEAFRDISHWQSQFPWRRALLSCCLHAELLHACLDRCAVSVELWCLHNQLDFAKLLHVSLYLPFVVGYLETPVVPCSPHDLKASLAAMTTQTNTDTNSHLHTHSAFCFLFLSFLSYKEWRWTITS